MDELVPIRNMDELKKILFIQRTVTNRAKSEMIALMGDGEVNPAEFFADAKRLLEKYALYPTLTEARDNPALTNVMKWGATFGVTALTGGLILEEVKHMQPHFESVLRQMFVLLLTEMAQPQHKYLVEPLEKAMKIRVTTDGNKDVSPEQAASFIRQVVQDLVQAYVIVGVQYGIVTAKDAHISITPLGRRVLLHMVDGDRFVTEMGRVHARFQALKPRLSMT
jgi:hypothetical protein